MPTCKHCGKEIIGRLKTAKYCGPACCQAAWRKVNRTKPAKSTFCGACGKEFRPSPENRRYCSPACRQAARSACCKPTPKPTAPAQRSPSLNCTLRELNEYNKTHGTFLSYGQWMGGMRA